MRRRAPTTVRAQSTTEETAKRKVVVIGNADHPASVQRASASQIPGMGVWARLTVLRLWGVCGMWSRWGLRGLWRLPPAPSKRVRRGDAAGRLSQPWRPQRGLENTAGPCGRGR